MPTLEYSSERTIIHAISPAVKFGWGALVMIWLFVIPNPVHMILFGLAIFAQGVIGAKIPPMRLIKTSLAIGIASVFIVVFQGLLYPGETVLFAVGPFEPTKEGISFGLTIALRVLSIVGASLTIAKTTDPHDIFLWLVKIGLPYKIAFGLFVALRFIPLMEYEAVNIQAAQYVRGISRPKNGLLNLYAQIQYFLVPFIAVGIRRADQSAIAMETRAFGLYPTRSSIRSLSFHPVYGKLFLAVWGLAFVAYIWLIHANIMSVFFFAPQH